MQYFIHIYSNVSNVKRKKKPQIKHGLLRQKTLIVIYLNFRNRTSFPKRRQSAPPQTTDDYDPDLNRESYIKAFKAFRARQHNENVSQHDNSIDRCKDDKSTENLYSSVNSQKMLDINKNRRHKDADSSNYDCAEEDYDYYMKSSSDRNRHSVPVNVSKAANRKTKNNSKKNQAPKPPVNQPATNNNNIIYENDIKDFETKHCNYHTNKLDVFNTTYNTGSPPKNFFRKNANPYAVQTTPISPPSSPKKTNESYVKGCVNATQKPISFPKRSSESFSLPHFSGSYRNFDLNASSTEERLRTKTDKERQKKPNNNKLVHERRKLCYEKQINKYGEVVEYAMPEGMSYSDRETTNSGDNLNDAEQLKSKVNNVNDINITNCDGIIEENFQFLNECIDISNMQSSAMIKTANSIRVTDLDASLETVDRTHRKFSINIQMAKIE